MSVPRCYALVLGLALLFILPELQAGRPPEWVMAEASRVSGAMEADQSGRVLLHECRIEVESSDEWCERLRYVARVGGQGGGRLASFSCDYVLGKDQVAQLNGWILNADGRIRSCQKSEWADVAVLGGESVYTDFRQKVLNLANEARDGDVFACEVVVQRRPNESEFGWVPGLSRVTQTARLRVKVPRGWSVRTQIHGQEPVFVDRGAEGQEWTWAGLPEELVPSRLGMLPLRYIRIALLSGQGKGGAPESWSDCARRMAAYEDASCDRSAELHATAVQLTEGLSDQVGKMRAVAAFVQKCRYAVDYRNQGPGFGFRPRLATEMLSTRYGDCKDKVNLLRALLRELGVRCIPVLVYGGSDYRVDEAWTGPGQFNHIIAGIQVPEDFATPAVSEVPGLGRLLFFDPTVEDIPFGQLPWVLTDTPGLPCDPVTKGLVLLPRGDPESRWGQSSTLKFQVNKEGGVEGTLDLVMRGELGSTMLAVCRKRPDATSGDEFQRFLSTAVPGLVLSHYEVRSGGGGERCHVLLSFVAPRFGQRSLTGPWFLRLDVLDRGQLPTLPAKASLRDHYLNPICQEESIECRLPEGYAVEALPPPVDIASVHGSYHVELSVDGGLVHLKRRLFMPGGRLPQAMFQGFRDFVLSVGKADQRSLVLRKL